MSIQPGEDLSALEGVHTPAAAQPVTERERIVSIDVLRGLAVLGILPMNIQSFSMINAAYWNPTAYGDLHGANFWVWFLCHIFADQKFMTIFSMLFGAGILLMTSRIEASGRPSAALHYRRMGWLVLFGILHSYLLWSGDILFSYGMCGLVAYLFRKRSPRTLLIVGLVILSMGSIALAAYQMSMRQLSADEMRIAQEQVWRPTAAMAGAELQAFRGGWLAEMPPRVNESVQMETLYFLLFTFWRACGLMLAGMALFKWGVFSAKAPARFYWVLIAAAVLVGIPVTVYGTWTNFQARWDFPDTLFSTMQTTYWASLLMSMGWVGVMMLLVRGGAVRWATWRLGAVGRMAFTNYLMHTVICTAIFYGYGFGLFGSVARTGQIAIVACVWAIQLIASPIWLRHFLFGPLEWLWRSLTYLRVEPLRRENAPKAA